MTVTLNLFNILLILFSVLALIDGIVRIRGRRVSTVLAILEIVLAALIILTFFFSPFVPLLWLAIALEVVLIIVIVTRGSGRGRGWLGLTCAAALAGLFVILNLLGILAF
jgi:hypothetical protein